MKRVLIQVVTAYILCFTLVYAKAETDDPEADMDFDLNGSDCIWIRSIRDYDPLDDRTLLIWSGSKRPYFVRLQTPDRDMRSGIGMQMDSRDDRLCPYGGDGLIFGNFSRFPTRIRSISKITKEQAEDILVRYGKKDAGEPQTPAPREVQGAEVEEPG